MVIYQLCLYLTDIGKTLKLPIPEKAVKVSPRSQPIVTASQLGAILQGARKSRKLTQAQLGHRLGLSQTRMSDLELAPGTLSVEQLLALCNQLGLQLSVQPRESSSPPANAADW